jgi:hypothetical protein
LWPLLVAKNLPPKNSNNSVPRGGLGKCNATIAATAVAACLVLVRVSGRNAARVSNDESVPVISC